MPSSPGATARSCRESCGRGGAQRRSGRRHAPRSRSCMGRPRRWRGCRPRPRRRSALWRGGRPSRRGGPPRPPRTPPPPPRPRQERGGGAPPAALPSTPFPDLPIPPPPPPEPLEEERRVLEALRTELAGKKEEFAKWISEQHEEMDRRVGTVRTEAEDLRHRERV